MFHYPPLEKVDENYKLPYLLNKRQNVDKTILDLQKKESWQEVCWQKRSFLLK